MSEDIFNRYRWACQVCDELFDREVWHCTECDHHWSVELDDQCRNCYKDRIEDVDRAAIHLDEI